MDVRFQRSLVAARQAPPNQRKRTVVDEIMSSRPASGSSTPSILRSRKRPLPPDRAKETVPTKQAARKATVGDDYIKKLADEVALADNKHMLYARRVNLEEQSEHSVRERLMSRGDCDLVRMACLVPQCGRQFESVRVLAWHMSYAHMDCDSEESMHASCLVCAAQMRSVKGKNSHLATAHRDLALLHNAQCLEQREPVIAPGAPAAERLARQQRVERLIDGQGIRSEYSHLLLLDEIGFEEDEIVEDVSVPHDCVDMDSASGGARRFPHNSQQRRHGIFPRQTVVVAADRVPDNLRPGSVVCEEIVSDPLIVVDDI